MATVKVKKKFLNFEEVQLIVEMKEGDHIWSVGWWSMVRATNCDLSM